MTRFGQFLRELRCSKVDTAIRPSDWLTVDSITIPKCFVRGVASFRWLKFLDSAAPIRLGYIDQADPTEAYAGPVYGPPMIHRTSREATFVFDFPAAGGNGLIKASGTTSMFREDFPQLVRTVVSTYWPPVVQDEHCQVPDASEAYSGAQCTGTYLSTPGLPEAPHAANAEDLLGPPNFNALVGNHLTVLVDLRLAPRLSAESGGAGN